MRDKEGERGRERANGSLCFSVKVTPRQFGSTQRSEMRRLQFQFLLTWIALSSAIQFEDEASTEDFDTNIEEVFFFLNLDDFIFWA